MYIIDGIAYAGEPQKPIRAKSVRALADHKLLVTFTNDEKKVYDFAPLLDMTCYKPLQDKAVFDRAYVDCGVVCWNDGEIDISPDTMYIEGTAYSEKETA